MKRIISIVLTVCMILSVSSVYAVDFSAKYVGEFTATDCGLPQAYGLAVEGDYCYISAREGGIRVFSIADLNNISEYQISNTDLRGTTVTSGVNKPISVYNGYLYARIANKLIKYSLEDPTSPQKVAAVSASPTGLSFVENYLYAITGSALKVYDISDDSLEEKASIEGTNLRGSFIKDGKLFVTASKAVSIYDIVDPEAPDLITTLALPDAGNLTDIFVNDNGIFISDFTNMLLVSIDIRNKTSLAELSDDDVNYYADWTADSNSKILGIYLDGNILYAGHQDGMMHVFDVTNPKEIIPIYYKATSVSTIFDVVKSGEYLYLAARADGVGIVKSPEAVVYAKIPTQITITELPYEINIGTIGETVKYDVYLNDKLVLEEQENDKLVISNLSNGTHTLGISVSGSNEITLYNLEVNYENTNVKAEIVSSTDDSTLITDVSEAIGVKVKVTNDSIANLEDVNLVVAAYEGKNMIAYEVKENIDIDAGDVYIAPISLDLTAVENIENISIKAFVLDSFSEPVLISDVYTITGVSYTSNKIFGDEEINGNGLRINCVPDHDNRLVDITVSLDSTYIPELAVMVVAPNGSTFADIEYVDVVESVNGNDGFTYKMKSTAEEIPFSVVSSVYGTFGGRETKTVQFVYVGPVTVNNILASLKTTDDVYSVLSDNSSLFQIDLSPTSEYAALDPEYQTEILDGMKKEFNSPDAVKIEFNNLIDSANLLTELNNKTDSTQIYNFISDENNRNKLEVNSLIYSELDESEEKTVANDVCTKISENNKFYSSKAFAEYYNNLIALTYLNNAGYLEMSEVLQKLNQSSLAEYDLSGDYSVLDNNEDELIYVHKKMERTTFTSIDISETKFDEFVSTAKINHDTPSNNNLGSSGISGSYGGGSSGGGGGKVSYVVPPVVETPQVPDVNTVSLSDVNDVDWARVAIKALVARNIISGYPDNTYRPNNLITREEFAKIVSEAFDFERIDEQSCFIDVSTDDWYYDYVMALENNDIISGIGEGRFGIGNNLTREDMAVILVRIMKLKALEKESEKSNKALEDVDSAADYAKESIEVIFNSGIMVGDGKNFAPKEPVTRAMVAKVIYEMIQLVEASK